MKKVKSEEKQIQPEQKFMDEYSSLCEKYGLMINVNPAFKSRDDGTWSVVLQVSVGKLPKKS